jgi:hypothetical protein
MSFLMSSSHWDLGLPAGLPVSGFHLYIFFTTPVKVTRTKKVYLSTVAQATETLER